MRIIRTSEAIKETRRAERALAEVHMGPPVVTGLDGPQTDLLAMLTAPRSWTTGEMDTLASDHGLMRSAAVEQLNTYAIAVTGQPVLTKVGDTFVLDEQVGHQLR